MWMYLRRYLKTGKLSSKVLWIVSKLIKMIPCPGTTRPRRGTTPTYNAPTPSLARICFRQSTVPLYCFAFVPCIRVLITSNGLLPSVEKHPALMPPNNPRRGVIGVSPLLVTISLYSLNHMKRNPMLEPCFSAVATTWRQGIYIPYVRDTSRSEQNTHYKRLTPW